MWSVATVGDWLFPNIKLEQLPHLWILQGTVHRSQRHTWEQDGLENKWLFTTAPFSKCQMSVLTMTFVPYEQYDLYIILKVTEDWEKIKIAILNGWTKL